MSERRFFIKDPLWKTIELAPWEMGVISHYFVNRLHSVVQNSSAFKVYPGMRHTRFVHSVGAVHVVSEMFVNAALNTEGSSLTAMEAEGDWAAAQLQQSPLLPKIIAWPGQRGCPERLRVLHGALRVGALVHDIGHMPYSHIFEFALEQAIKRGVEPLQRTILPSHHDETKQLDRVVGVLRELLSSEEHDGHKLHELIGRTLIGVLAKDLGGDAGDLVALAAKILHNESAPIARSFLEQDVDADRIDFIARDGLFSGAYQSGVDHSRLFAFYEIAAEKNGALRARPSSRASGESEKLLLERFQDYLHIAAHHRVHFFDELLERVILVTLLRGKLNQLLEAIARLADADEGGSYSDEVRRAEAKRDLISYGDDAALDVEIRSLHAEVLKSGNGESERLHLILEGLTERRGLFVSLFKTGRTLDHRVKDAIEELSSLGDGSEADPDAARSAIALLVKEQKFELERSIELSLAGRVKVVIVGDVYGKTRVGIDSDSTAQFFGMEAVRDFMKDKRLDMPPFNVWFVPLDRSPESLEGIRSDIIALVINHVKEAMKDGTEDAN